MGKFTTDIFSFITIEFERTLEEQWIVVSAHVQQLYKLLVIPKCFSTRYHQENRMEIGVAGKETKRGRKKTVEKCYTQKQLTQSLEITLSRCVCYVLHGNTYLLRVVRRVWRLNSKNVKEGKTVPCKGMSHCGTVFLLHGFFQHLYPSLTYACFWLYIAFIYF